MAARSVLTAAMVETALVTWRDLSQEKLLPPPSDYVAVIIIFGGLSLLPDPAQGFASVTAWGFVIATFLGLWSPQAPLKLAVPGGTANVQAGQPTTITPAQPNARPAGG